jgi:hypothetical protein
VRAATATLFAILAVMVGCADIQPSLFGNLPKTIGGETLVYSYLDPTTPNSWQAEVLALSGHPAAAMTVAETATSPNVHFSSELVRIKGMQGTDLIPMMVKGFGFVPEPPKSATIEGKSVVSYTCRSQDVVTDCGSYLYALGDTAMSIVGSPEAIREALRQIP